MIGKHLSHYLIEAELGRGGMGIVYKARDTKLDRTVAIKVLPSAALASADDRARFYREAKAAAALTHPHIAIIHAVDEAVPEGAPHGTEPSPFIAMEFIDGETLEARIAKGPLKLEEAVRIATEIASALKLAHENDIVHRDIKSANVMLGKDNSAKVLDFGLAQTAQSTKLTRMGSTLGTVAYMSPEQARGEPVDRRTDLWSLGVVLYEMLVGRPAFGGDYEQAVVYTILNEEPEPVTALRAGIPMDVEWIIGKCLAKKADERYQSADDLLADLKRLTGSLASARISSAQTAAAQAASRMSSVRPSAPGMYEAGAVQSVAQTALPAGKMALPRWAVYFTGIALVALLIVSVAALTDKSRNDVVPLTRKLEIVLPGIEIARFPKISPDKKWISFAGRDSLQRRGLFLLEVATNEVHYTVESEGISEHAAFSPGSDRIAFGKSGAKRGIYISVVPGGVPRRLTDYARIPVWLDDSLIVVLDRIADNRPRIINVNSGDTTRVALSRYPVLDENLLYWTSLLPNSGTLIADLEPSSTGGGIGGGLAFLDPQSGTLQVSDPGIINPYYAPDGYLVYQRGTDESGLIIQSFDAQTRALKGAPRQVIDHMSWEAFSLGTDGSLVYAPQMIQGGGTLMNFFDVDFAGRQVTRIPIGTTSLIFTPPRLSPTDPNVVLLGIRQGRLNTTGYFGTLDLRTGRITQRTQSGHYGNSTWGPDGNSIYYTDVDAGSVMHLSLLAGASPEAIIPDASDPAVSPDGRFLAVAMNKGDADTDLYLVDLETQERVPIDTLRGSVSEPSFSSDGRYLVYRRIDTATSFEQGMIAEVNGPGRIALAVGQMRSPQWTYDDSAILYFDDQDLLYRLDIDMSRGIPTPGQPRILADLRMPRGLMVARDSPRIGILAGRFDPIWDRGQQATLVWWENWTRDFK